MGNNASKTSKRSKIVLKAVISIVLLCVLLIGSAFIFSIPPHTKHFDSVYKVSDNRYVGKYLYCASSNGAVSYLRADDDLTKPFESNGEQDARVRATGIDMYRTDVSGIFVSYPVIVYEYIG